MTFLRAMLPIALLVFCAGCGEKAADLSAPKTYSNEGVSFEYPGNWEIGVETAVAGFVSVLVHTKGEGLVMVEVSTDEEFEGLREYAEKFAGDMEGGSALEKITSSTFEEMTERHGFERISGSFDVVVLGEKVPHQHIFASKVVGDTRQLLMFQVATEDVAKAEPGFDLILKTLKVDQRGD